MDESLNAIERQVRRLSADDRARLAELLLESLRETPVADVQRAWEAEINARAAAYDRGEVETHLAADVFAQAALQQRREQLDASRIRRSSA